MSTEVLVPGSANCTGRKTLDSGDPFPPDTLVQDVSEIAFSGAEDTAAGTDDTSYVFYSGAFSGFRVTFRSTQAEGDISQVTPSFIIRGNGVQWAQAKYLYVWDFTTTAWVQIDTVAVPAADTDIELTADVTTGDFVDANSDVHILCLHAGVGVKMNFYLDLAQLTVTYTATAPEIAVTGNGQNIADGDGTPSVTDDTDFGEQIENVGTHDHVFTITNSGDANLTVENVVLAGTNADQFSIQEQPASPIAPAGTDTFTIRFEPTSTGVKSATLSMPNNDADENPFNFSIAGTGIAAAASNSILLAARYRGLIVRD